MKHAQTISALVLLTTGVILSFIGFFTEPVGEMATTNTFPLNASESLRLAL